LDFYNDGEYNEWKEENDSKGWKIKYYKGLGTSTGKEFREYFEKKKFVGFERSEKSDDAIDMVFNKKRADDRKDWLKLYDRDAYLDTSKQSVSYEEFIDRELIHFSKYDCDRSIPNLMDGLKISLRKILFSAFKKNLTSEIKVAQFSGYVSEHSGYHHGEASLNAAIVGMAQNFVGSNNINLFMPNGQFGTRLQGGKDSASERYIFTQLAKITRTLFPAADDNVLQYLNDDGLLVEPIYYAPIVPMVLINGSKGIGTGFSTDIMCYNPLEIITYLKGKLLNVNSTEDFEFMPYYEGYKILMKNGAGVLVKINNNIFVHGSLERRKKLEYYDNINKILNSPTTPQDLLEDTIDDYTNLNNKSMNSMVWSQKDGKIEDINKRINDSSEKVKYCTDIEDNLKYLTGLSDITNLKLFVGHCVQSLSSIMNKQNTTFTKFNNDPTKKFIEIIEPPADSGLSNPDTNFLFGMTMECEKTPELNNHYVYHVDIGSSRSFDNNIYFMPRNKRDEKIEFHSRSPQIMEIYNNDTNVRIVRSTIKNTRIHLPRTAYETHASSIPDLDLATYNKYLKYKKKYLQLKNKL
jgi:DNA topoisomerase-2